MEEERIEEDLQPNMPQEEMQQENIEVPSSQMSSQPLSAPIEVDTFDKFIDETLLSMFGRDIRDQQEQAQDDLPPHGKQQLDEPSSTEE